MNNLLKYVLIVVLAGTGFTALGQPFRHDREMSPYRGRSVPYHAGPIPQFGPYHSRPGPQGRYVDKIQAAKETFINMQLQLTQDEAYRFWPVYRQYEQEIANVRRAKRTNLLSNQSNSSDQINKELYYEERLLEIHKHYTAEFLRILPPQKVSMIYKSERQFNDELIRQMNERRVQQQR